MYVVTVEFDIAPEHRSAFLDAVKQQAGESLTKETACRQFDVCTIASGDDEIVFLYELYDDRAAFDLHLQSEHFARFNEKVGPFTRGKIVRCGALEQGSLS